MNDNFNEGVYLFEKKIDFIFFCLENFGKIIKLNE